MIGTVGEDVAISESNHVFATCHTAPPSSNTGQRAQPTIGSMHCNVYLSMNHQPTAAIAKIIA